MPPRIELALAAATLAALLALAGTAALGERGWLGFGVEQASMAAPAAFVATWWVAGWGLLLRPGRRGWRALGLSVAATIIAMLVFALIVCVTTVVGQAGSIEVLGLDPVVNEAAKLATLFLIFAVLLGGLPAVVLTFPLSLRYLRRRASQQALS